MTFRPAIATIIAFAACFYQTANANLNHAITMNEATHVISRQHRPINLTGRQIIKFWQKVEKLATEGGCWVWMGSSDEHGYGQLRIARNQLTSAHRISWVLHNGEIPQGLGVLHQCDVPACVRPDHLFLGTQQDNVNDMLAKGRCSRGERHGMILKAVCQRGENHVYKRRPDLIPRGERQSGTKLKTADVIAIRRAYSEGGITQKQLGEKYGVWQGCISSIILRRNWSHIE